MSLVFAVYGKRFWLSIARRGISKAWSFWYLKAEAPGDPPPFGKWFFLVLQFALVVFVSVLRCVSDVPVRSGEQFDAKRSRWPPIPQVCPPPSPSPPEGIGSEGFPCTGRRRLAFIRSCHFRLPCKPCMKSSLSVRCVLSFRPESGIKTSESEAGTASSFF